MAYNKAVSKVKVLVFCGGSGAKALEEGFYRFFPQVSPQYAINMYDDGQSSGICRQLFGILGPSDLRKIQIYQHCLRFGQTPLSSFLGKRLTVRPQTKGYVFFQIKRLLGDSLTAAQAEALRLAATIFFEKLGRRVFKNFSLANILYSGLMVRENLNYSAVEKLMADILKIPPQTVIINSYQSLFLQGTTQRGKLIKGEHHLDFGDKGDPLKEVFLVDENGRRVVPLLSPELAAAIKESQIIIFSSGNYWASLIPTLLTKGVSQLLAASPAKKFLVMNNEAGSDMRGMRSDAVQEVVYHYLPPETITLFNTEAEKKMTQANPHFPALALPLSKNNRRHDPGLLCQAIMAQGSS
jgi:2-phospho-L-lactate transferase/gluconeogenesis factor (CofD/UPF0052 family)